MCLSLGVCDELFVEFCVFFLGGGVSFFGFVLLRFFVLVVVLF